MRIGAICRMDATGLGIQSKEFFDNIPCKALVIDVSKISSSIPQHPEWYPNQLIHQITRMGFIPDQIMFDFVKDIDVLITFENPYDYKLFDICRHSGVKSILQLNYEFLEYPSHFPKPDLFIAPSLWHYDDIPEPKQFLTVPVNTKYFTPQRKEKTFVHIQGRSAAYDRNGTHTLLNSLQYVKNEIEIIIRSQHPFHINSPIPENVKLTKDTSNKENYYDNYSGGVLIMPRKYGGLCLPMHESIATEMPIITTDISPNNQWLPKEWLVPAIHSTTFRCKKQVDVYEAEVRKLADKIDEFCDVDFYNAAIEKAKVLKEGISWETLLPKYLSLFEKITSPL